jgi:hypothetical protein
MMEQAMRSILMVVIGLSTLALSQLVTPGAVRAQKSSTAAAQRQAPVGHRQPRSQDAPSEQSAEDAGKEADRALDKALKSICRGC